MQLEGHGVGLAAHNKTWLGVRIELEEGVDGNEDIDIHYEENRSGDYNAFITQAVDTSGTERWGTNNEGIQAKTMSFQLHLNRRSGTNTERVIFREMEVYFISDPATQWLHDFYIDLDATMLQVESRETRAAERLVIRLDTVEANGTLVTYKYSKRAETRVKAILMEFEEDVEDWENLQEVCWTEANPWVKSVASRRMVLFTRVQLSGTLLDATPAVHLSICPSPWRMSPMMRVSSTLGIMRKVAARLMPTFTAFSRARKVMGPRIIS